MDLLWASFASSSCDRHPAAALSAVWLAPCCAGSVLLRRLPLLRQPVLSWPARLPTRSCLFSPSSMAASGSATRSSVFADDAPADEGTTWMQVGRRDTDSGGGASRRRPGWIRMLMLFLLFSCAHVVASRSNGHGRTSSKMRAADSSPPSCRTRRKGRRGQTPHTPTSRWNLALGCVPLPPCRQQRPDGI